MASVIASLAEQDGNHARGSEWIKHGLGWVWRCVEDRLCRVRPAVWHAGAAAGLRRGGGGSGSGLDALCPVGACNDFVSIADYFQRHDFAEYRHAVRCVWVGCSCDDLEAFTLSE
jgi:hypothetical protein